MSLQWPDAEIITVPGDLTFKPSYFWTIDNESFPVGIFIPKSIANSEQAWTALYSLESSPSFPHGHIQLAESDTDLIPFSRGAHIILVKDSPIELILPMLGSIRPETGECPIDEAIPV